MLKNCCILKHYIIVKCKKYKYPFTKYPFISSFHQNDKWLNYPSPTKLIWQDVALKLEGGMKNLYIT
jgi:hypothetical protein